MDLFFDRATNTLTRLAGGGGLLRTLDGKRGDTLPCRLYFYDGETAEGELAGDVEIRFGLKETLDGDLLAVASSWSEAEGIYSAQLSLNTAELLEAVGETAATVSLLAELTVSTDGGDTWSSSQTVSFAVKGDVNRDDDGPPQELPGPLSWLAANGIVYDPAITGLTGGGGDKLDGIVTDGVAVGRLQAYVADGVVTLYRLTAGTLPENAYEVIRPDDYDEATNAKYWQIQGLALSSLEVGRGGSIILNKSAGTGALNLDLTSLTDTRDVVFLDRDGTAALLVNPDAAVDGGGVALVGAALEVVLWNTTQNKFQGLRLSGAAGAETIQIFDLP